MFGVADYGAFVIAILIFLLIPGPGNLALITSTTKGGIRGGVAAIGGSSRVTKSCCGWRSPAWRPC